MCFKKAIHNHRVVASMPEKRQNERTSLSLRVPATGVRAVRTDSVASDGAAGGRSRAARRAYRRREGRA